MTNQSISVATPMIWEMDFNALPLRDANDKRVWELLVCDTSGSFKQACYCNNQQVKSEWVAEQLQQYLDMVPHPPVAVRVFRSRMASILQRGCAAVGLPMRPSRRVYTLKQWMQQRAADVYPNESQFTYQPNDVLTMDPDAPTPTVLPDKLRGERWALVNLRATEMTGIDEWPADFKDVFPVAWDEMDPELPIPGVIIVSRRAAALAAWMGGIEPACVHTVSGNRPNLVLEAGLSDSYILGNLTNPELQAEADHFETRKQGSTGIHFLAIQTDLNAQMFNGFWLLKDPDQ